MNTMLKLNKLDLKRRRKKRKSADVWKFVEKYTASEAAKNDVISIKKRLKEVKSAETQVIK